MPPKQKVMKSQKAGARFIHTISLRQALLTRSDATLPAKVFSVYGNIFLATTLIADFATAFYLKDVERCKAEALPNCGEYLATKVELGIASLISFSIFVMVFSVCWLLSKSPRNYAKIISFKRAFIPNLVVIILMLIKCTNWFILELKPGPQMCATSLWLYEGLILTIVALIMMLTMWNAWYNAGQSEIYVCNLTESK